ncbi:MAG: acyl-CoA synthetase [Burkholderiaceae bacterium]|nr:acyl-CoA synthetase [Burkholderiaceae bacterium]
MSTALYATGLDQGPANFTAQTPIQFIERAALAYPRKTAVIHGDLKRTWADTFTRCKRLASSLSQLGIQRAETVAVMLPNTPPMVEAHFGIAMAGAVLCALNTRQDPRALAYMLAHSEAKVLIVDQEFAGPIQAALDMLTQDKQPLPKLVEVDDPLYQGPRIQLGGLDYEALLASADPEFEIVRPQNEWDPICLNYTSGTTGNPKGVVYSHRGAYTNGVSNALEWGMQRHPVYLWVLPMFHCNGWCFPWTVAAMAGVNVCLRRVEAQPIFDAIRTHRVTHYCGAPIVQNLLINAPDHLKAGIEHRVQTMVGGAAPPAAMIEGMEKMGFEILHAYGLTEVYGPVLIGVQQDEWAALPLQERAELNSRQGICKQLEQQVAVLDPETMQPVPMDGETIGEIMIRGNVVMRGYLKNPEATAQALKGGWFHSGDLAVVYPDGYMKIKDRSKDIIISGGENISSIEVEDALYRHPAVLAAAVVAKPDAQWGETPCAFVELKPGAAATEEDIIRHCRTLLAGFKSPRAVVFGELPKTSTGKIQKFELRKRLES